MLTVSHTRTFGAPQATTTRVITYTADMDAPTGAIVTMHHLGPNKSSASAEIYRTADWLGSIARYVGKTWTTGEDGVGPAALVSGY